MKLVMKFGGTSVADAERIRRCAQLVKERLKTDRVVTVVSALDGITEDLLAVAEAAAAANDPVLDAHLAQIRKRHQKAGAELGEPELLRPLQEQLDRLALGISAVGELTPRSRDAVLSFGERMSSLLFRKALELEGVKSKALTGQEAGLVTDETYGEAEPLMELSLYQIAEKLKPALEAGEAPVVAGFIAATQHGVVTTIGRGGSDFTATILGAAIKADEIWIWSDVDGLMSADPKIVPGARLLPRISFAEAVEMGQFGAKSMHPRALEPAAERKIPVRMKNTFKPEGEGTLIAQEGDGAGAVARAILLVKDCGLITVTGAAMIGRPGTAARILQTLAERNINIRMISQSVSEAGLSLAVAGKQLQRARGALESALLRTGVARHVQVDEEVAIVAVVGSNMRGMPGVAARVFAAVAKKNVNVIAIAQGSSEISISFIVKREAGAEAVRALHENLLAGVSE